MTFRIDYEDSGTDITRAVMRWRSRTGYQRYHDHVQVLPIAAGALGDQAVGHADVVIVPPQVGRWRT